MNCDCHKIFLQFVTEAEVSASWSNRCGVVNSTASRYLIWNLLSKSMRSYCGDDPIYLFQ